MSKIDSVVICKQGKGYVASLRFADKTEDKDISHSDKNSLYKMINYLVEKGVSNG